MKNIKLLSILNLSFFIAAFLISIGSQLKIIKGQDIGEVSNKYDTSFTPAGLTFSIWGVIYISLTGFCIYHLIKSFRNSEKDEANQEIADIGILFIINNTAASLWVIAWLNEQLIMSAILMVIQLITLVSINTRIGLYNPEKTLMSRIFTQFPLSIYFAWICVATVANINAALLHTSWIIWPLEDTYWTVILIGLITLVSIYIILIRRNVFYGLVIIWAVYGIILKRTSIDQTAFENIIMAGWTAIGIIILVELIQIFKNLKYRHVRL